jgi:hypothetical protein
MSEFLENLKQGTQEAHRKFVAAQQKFTSTQTEFQAVQQRLARDQAEFQAAAQEFQAFQTLVNLQTRKEQPPNAATPAPQLAAVAQGTPVNLVNAVNIPPQPRVLINQNVSAPPAMSEEVRPESNKTEAVRTLLRQHANGMTPGEIWKSLNSELNRVYLYSVLKRLKDRGDVREKRGKYYFNVKADENQNPHLVQ